MRTRLEGRCARQGEGAARPADHGTTSGIILELNQAKAGKVFRMLVGKAEGGHFIASTEFDSPEPDNEVLIPTKDDCLRVGDFAEVCIIEADEHDLRAEVARFLCVEQLRLVAETPSGCLRIN
ncbi:MAG TPA: hypothetical protein PKY96_18420 [Flavobacteriales bacterium]|nr:hypothetical protein [Flavobacteriales bacterium]